MKKCIVKKNGYTLLELMITISVIGVISVLAIPAYQDYVTRTQVAESIALFDGKRTKAEDFLYLNGDGDIGDRKFSQILPLNSEYIEKILESYNNNYNIAFLYGVNSNKPLQGKSILFFNEATEKETVLWKCETNIAKKYLPTSLNCEVNDLPIVDPGNGGNYTCDETTPPNNTNAIPGLELMYDNGGYLYYKQLANGKMIYDSGGTYYQSNDGYNVFFGQSYSNGEVSFPLTINDGNAIVGNNGETIDMRYFSYQNALGKYVEAVRKVEEFKKTPPITDFQKGREQYYKDIVADQNNRNEANQFFNNFEDMYVNNGVISPDAPFMLSQIYQNLDRDTFIMGDGIKDVFDINNHSDLSGLNMEDEIHVNYPYYSCNQNSGEIES